MLKILKNRYVAVLPVFAVVLIIAMTGFSSANVETDSSESIISVTGVGTVEVKPDQAVVSLGVMTRAVTASEAVSENSQVMNAVVVALQELGIDASDIQTSWYSVNPVYDWNEFRGTPTIIGYEAVNTVTVTTSDFEIVGSIIDSTTAVGVNQINGITFKVSDEAQSQLEDEALQNACADVKAKADVIADSLDVSIIGVKSVSVSSGWPIMPYYSALDVRAVETPIFPGESEVTVTVYVEFLIHKF